MQFKLTTGLFVISTALLAEPASAIPYDGFASTVSCQGVAFGCSDKDPSQPAGTQGQGYTGGGCTDYLFTVYGPGTRCWSGGGGARATHIGWFHSALTRRSEVTTETRGKGNGTCTPDYFKYQDSNGVDRKIKVPTDDVNAVETMAKLYTDKSFDALAKYEEY